jgi:hypothetical protein
LLWLFFTRAYFFAQLTFGFLTHQQHWWCNHLLSLSFWRHLSYECPSLS